MEDAVNEIKVTSRNIDKYAGIRKFRFGEAEEENIVGVATA